MINRYWSPLKFKNQGILKAHFTFISSLTSYKYESSLYFNLFKAFKKLCKFFCDALCVSGGGTCASPQGHACVYFIFSLEFLIVPCKPKIFIYSFICLLISSSYNIWDTVLALNIHIIEHHPYSNRYNLIFSSFKLLNLLILCRHNEPFLWQVLQMFLSPRLIFLIVCPAT